MLTIRKSLIYLLSALTLSGLLPVMAANQLVLMGGAGEPKGPKTIFDSGLKAFAPNLNNSNWQYEISFNGGHETTENILKNYSKSPNKPFTKKSFEDLIKSYKEKIMSGEIKEDEQLMIVIDTHGAINNDTKQSTHGISVTGGEVKDFKTLEGSEKVSLDALKDLVKMAEGKRVKLGIVDLSCHSGSTQELKKSIGIETPNTCIITATGPDHFAFAGENSFADLFFQNLKKGKTLEQVFLQSRLASTDPGFPMISTEESESISRDFYKAITPYLYYHDVKSAKLTDHLDYINQTDLIMICTKEKQFQNLIEQINRLESVTSPLKFGKLKSLLGQYKKLQNETLLRLRGLNGNLLDTKIQITTPVKNSKTPIDHTYTVKEILMDNEQAPVDPKTGKRPPAFEELIDHFTKKAAASPVDREYSLALATQYRKLRDKKTELMSRYPKLKNYEEEKKNLFKSITSTKEIAEQIALEEKSLYDSLYKERQGINFNDPCRKIVF